MSILVDTNVLVPTQPDHPSHAIAVESVARLLAGGELACFTLQNAAEFWNVATRSRENNGLGLSVSATLAELSEMERWLVFLPDAPGLYSEWKRLVAGYSVLGVKVHDTRLVAAMNLHGVGRILTFNTSDFARFAVEAVHPASLVPV